VRKKHRDGTAVKICLLKNSVPDPDPPDPHVFGTPESEVWIRILLSSSKNSKKNLDSYCFVTFLDFFLSLKKNDVIVPSKSIKQKNLLKK
jgi:hypothetical protein